MLKSFCTNKRLIMKQNIKNIKNIIKYSDTEVLGLVMAAVLAVINPLVFLNISNQYPMWLIFLGIPFGIYLLYNLSVKCSSRINLSYTLILGQIIGIILIVFGSPALLYMFVFQFLVFCYLKWRSNIDFFRKRRSKKC